MRFYPNFHPQIIIHKKLVFQLGYEPLTASVITLCWPPQSPVLKVYIATAGSNPFSDKRNPFVYLQITDFTCITTLIPVKKMLKVFTQGLKITMSALCMGDFSIIYVCLGLTVGTMPANDKD